MNDLTAELGFRPRTFALRAYPHDDTPVIVAWGMTLPDGSALTISWHSPTTVMTVCDNPHRAALLQGAEVIWVDHEEHTPKGPP